MIRAVLVKKINALGLYAMNNAAWWCQAKGT